MCVRSLCVCVWCVRQRKRESVCVCMCVPFPYSQPDIVFCSKNTQREHQFIPILLISSEAKDVSIHIHASLETRRGGTFTAHIYHITLNVIRAGKHNFAKYKSYISNLENETILIVRSSFAFNPVCVIPLQFLELNAPDRIN